MYFAVSFNPTDLSMNVLELGRAVEERGFETLFFPEHTHLPVGGTSQYPYGPELSPLYRRTYAPIVAMTAVASVTQRLRVGTAVLLVVEHDPILLAKELASLDHLSNGRVTFGVGAGWNEEEMRNHGTDPKTRFQVLRERVQAMKTIWTQDESAYHGTFVDFDPIWLWPKPIQSAGPPVLIGGIGPRVLDRVVAYGDGWIPSASSGIENVLAQIPELNRRAEAAGRGRLPVTITSTPPELAVLEQYRAAGVDRASFGLPQGGRDAVLPVLDQLAKIVEEFHSSYPD